ncbi:carbohydrate ABC transporter permease, partial [Salmonella enterica subsp. enterica serovar Infantis]|nr:carbohydrate ABC transporter permease [Salmonella enterica subsp. enterica serovar Infantis]
MSKAMIRKTILTVVMLFFSIVMIVPFLWMISTSFKTPAEVFEYPIRWIPAHFNWSHHV